ncbi:hypothetical protein ACH5A7_20915 [Streptomyces sp. NPDC018955]|uniref:hypothetical protein n=1 Tax=Streptomyces sp. NPDC018955 TaxID=3365055 RepID=UPI0037AB14F1
MNSDLYARAAAVIDAKRDKTTARRRGAVDTAILGTVPLLAVAVAFASGWSLYDLGRHFHMPDWAAWAVFALIDVVWFQSAIVVIKNQRSPHRAIEAHKRMQGMFAVSVVANFVHGLILFGATPSGFVAGAVFALFPIGFKAAFSNAFPDYVKRARKAGYGHELDKAFHTEALMFIMSGVDQVKAELGQPTDRATVRLQRADHPAGPPSDRVESTPVQAADQPTEQIEATPEPVLVQAVGRAVDRPVRPEDQVDELFRRLRNGDHITKQGAADILGVSPSTAYRRLKDAESKLHQYR